MTDLDDDDPEPRQVIGIGLATYAVMVAVALGWLSCRERLAELHTQAVGTHGPWLAAGAGVVTGVLMATALAWLSPRSQMLREYDAVVARTFAGTGEAVTMLVVLGGAIAEELLCRLAAQDAIGLPATVALNSLLYSCIGGWRWLLIMAPHALLLGLLVHFGLGLLASTTANAIMNHLNLRRLRC